jgi:hypothetical protein
MSEKSQVDLKNPENQEKYLRPINQVIPHFIETQLETVKDLPIVTEMQAASTEMISALDSGNHEATFEYWQKFFDKYEQIRVAYHEAAHAVVGYRLKNNFNRRILRVSVNAQIAKARGVGIGFVDFEGPDPQNKTEAQAQLARVLTGYLNEPSIKTEVMDLGGDIENSTDAKEYSDAKQRDDILTKWFFETENARLLVMGEATREATWVGQRTAISALARILLLEPTLELDEQAAYEFLSNRPELKW